jgi:hypothetical protein
MFNPDYFGCFINSSPPGCIYDCARGGRPSMFRWLFFYGPAWTMIVLISAMMTLLYWTVLNQERRMDRFRFRAEATASGNNQKNALDHTVVHTESTIGDNGESGKTVITPAQHHAEHPQQAENRERSNQVAIQGLWYTVPFVLTWIFPLIAHALGPAWIGRKGKPLLVLVVIFLPLQGFMNALVYVRPKLQSRFCSKRTGSGTRTRRSSS